MKDESLHYLESMDEDKAVFVYNEFDEKKIKQDIFDWLEKHPKDELWQYRKNYNKKYVGDNYIDAFVNHKGNVCKLIIRGDRTFFKKLR